MKRRHVLQFAGSAAGGLVGVTSVAGASDEEGPVPNLGVFNNSDQNVALRVEISGDGESPLFRKTYALKGLNAPGTRDPSKSYDDDEVVDISAPESGWYTFRAILPGRDDAERQIFVSEFGLEPRSVLSAYYTRDGDVRVEQSYRHGGS